MATTKYSHAFLVGSFNGDLTPEKLSNDCQNWTEDIIENSPCNNKRRYEGDRGYDGLCNIYYKAHLDAIIKAQSQERPDFLKCICHYTHKIDAKKQEVPLSRIIVKNNEKKEETTIVQHLDDYHLNIVAIHVHFFPLNIVLFSIEIDDSNSEFNSLTMGHSWLMNWIWNGNSRFHDNTKNIFREKLAPLIPYLKDKTLSNLIDGGNKMKLFQIIKTDNINDHLLYELGTSSPIGCVGGNMWLTPSDDYYNRIINDNTISAFKNWKGLALVDSFTLLGTSQSFDEDDCNFMYFPLIYLRCIFEKTFCFSRNNVYRMDKNKGNLSQEIIMIEKYYFYDNISYNFLPNLLYKSMAKGLGIEEEREELSRQIKEKETNNRDIILAIVSGFAIFSIVFDLYSIIIAAMGIPSESVNWIAQLLISVGVLFSIILGYIFFSHRRV